jgi:hypothetical protein
MKPPLRNNPLAALGLLLSLAACGGGGSNGHSAALPVRAPVAVAVNIKIPSPGAQTSAKKRHALYVSPGTQSATIRAYDGSASNRPLLLTATLACSSGTCSGTIAVPVTTVVFDVGLFDGKNGTGNALSLGAVTQTIRAGINNVVDITFGGVIAQLTIAGPTANPAFTFGTPSSLKFSYAAEDAAGYTIVGTYANGIGLALDPADCGVAIVNKPPYAFALDTADSTFTLAYDGSTNFTPADLVVDATYERPNDPNQTAGASTCDARSTAALAVHLIVGGIAGPSAVGIIGTGTANSDTSSISEAGYGAAAFSVDTLDHGVATAAASVTLNDSAALTVTGVAAGTTSLVVTDVYGLTLTIPVSVTTTTIVGS